MSGNKYSINSSDSDCYFTEGNFKKSSNNSSIFDKPEFVIDMYLEAMNGGAPLSGKYANYNCNHNTDDSPGAPCPCNAPKSGSCCGEGESPYEKGATHYEEVKKDGVSSCTTGTCDNEQVYEAGKTFHEEVKKEGGCCACNGDSPYADGMLEPVLPDLPEPEKPKGCPPRDMEIHEKYPLECGRDNVYADGESCALCVKR